MYFFHQCLPLGCAVFWCLGLQSQSRIGWILIAWPCITGNKALYLFVGLNMYNFMHFKGSWSCKCLIFFYNVLRIRQTILLGKVFFLWRSFKQNMHFKIGLHVRVVFIRSHLNIFLSFQQLWVEFQNFYSQLNKISGFIRLKSTNTVNGYGHGDELKAGGEETPTTRLWQMTFKWPGPK